MKELRGQINVLLILGFFFIVWLFGNSALTYYSDVIQMNTDKQMLELEEVRLNMDLYTIITGPMGLPFLLNKKTGETWRYYRNQENGEPKSEGWIFLNKKR